MGKHSFVAFGNPLLDTTIELEDDSVLKKYGFKEDTQAEISQEVLDSLLKHVSPRWRAGGSATNAARLLAQLGASAALLGGASAPERAPRLIDAALLPGLQHHPDLPPGRCVCLVLGAHRTLLANIGAAGHFSLDYLINTEELQDMLNSATVVHAEGFFLSNRFPVCQYLVDEVQHKRNKPLSYNLAAIYIINDLRRESAYMAENADMVFGNANEYHALAESYSLDTAEECAKKLHSLWIAKNEKSRMKHYGKILVVTNGSKEILVVWGKDEVHVSRCSAPKLPSEKVVDTTGAGDAFMAGFVWALMNDRCIEECLHFACRLVAVVISYVGMELPNGTHLPGLDDCVQNCD